MANIITSQNTYEVNEQLIDAETQRRIDAVPGAEHYGIMTAAVIDGDFVLCSDWEVPADMRELLENVQDEVVETSLNTINGFIITDRVLKSEALNFKLSQYREYLAQSNDPFYSDIIDVVKKQLARIENILVKNKALVAIQ